MAGRKRKLEFVKSPNVEIGRALAKDVFRLQDRLNMSDVDMAKELGLTLHGLHNLRSSWIKSETKAYKRAARMKLSWANRLVQFWNNHLLNGGSSKGKVKHRGPALPDSSKLAGTPVLKHEKIDDVTSVALKQLVARVGPTEAIRLLMEKGKTAAVARVMEELSPEMLANLV